jgi:predicted dehydrogenase
LRVIIHLDLYGRPHEKSIRFVGEGGTLVWTAEPNKIKVSLSSEQIWEEEIFDCVRNDMFVSVAQEFINLINGDLDGLTCHLKDGLSVMKIIEIIRTSSKEGRIVHVGEKS